MTSQNGPLRPGRIPVVLKPDDITLEPVTEVPPIKYGNAVARYRIQQFIDSDAKAAAVRTDLNWRSVYDALKHAVVSWDGYIPVTVTYRRGLDGARTVYLQRTDGSVSDG